MTKSALKKTISKIENRAHDEAARLGEEGHDVGQNVVRELASKLSGVVASLPGEEVQPAR